MLKKILTVGYSTRNIVCSGKKAGYSMYAVDAFGDVDLRRCSDWYCPLDRFLKADERELSALKEIDGIILGSGVETLNTDFKPLKGKKRLCNDREKMKKVMNKLWLSERLQDLGFPHPRTWSSEDIKELKKIRFPLVAKPVRGGGGVENFLCHDEADLKKALRRSKNFIFQEFIDGTHASVSLLSTRNDVMSISVNEQMIGEKEFCAGKPFMYCGNITPLVSPMSDRMRDIAEELICELRLIGSNGVDFVVSGSDVFVIEVNPRIQGSLDTVELSTGINLVDAHVKAICGKMTIEPDTKRKIFAVRAIVFADRKVKVIRSLDVEGIVDISEEGRVIEKDEPIASAVGTGDTKGEALSDAMDKVSYIKSSVIAV